MCEGENNVWRKYNNCWWWRYRFLTFTVQNSHFSKNNLITLKVQEGLFKCIKEENSFKEDSQFCRWRTLQTLKMTRISVPCWETTKISQVHHSETFLGENKRIMNVRLMVLKMRIYSIEKIPSECELLVNTISWNYTPIREGTAGTHHSNNRSSGEETQQERMYVWRETIRNLLLGNL